jgi:hypothetical protein
VGVKPARRAVIRIPELSRCQPASPDARRPGSSYTVNSTAQPSAQHARWQPPGRRAKATSSPVENSGLPNFTIVGLTGPPEAEDVPLFSPRVTFWHTGTCLAGWTAPSPHPRPPARACGCQRCVLPPSPAHHTWAGRRCLAGRTAGRRGRCDPAQRYRRPDASDAGRRPHRAPEASRRAG